MADGVEKEQVPPQAMSNGTIPELESGDDADTPEPLTLIGTSCTVMTLWEGESSGNRISWLTEPPEVEADQQSETTSSEYAITLQHRNYKDKSQRQKLDTIIIRSPELREFLDEAIPNISSLYNEAEQGIAIRTPYRLLFWHLDQIEEAGKSDNANLNKVTDLLLDVLEKEFRELLARRRDMVERFQETNFDTLWTLFKPGITCITDFVHDVMSAKVTAIDFSRDPMGHLYYRIKYKSLLWDGEHLGWQDSDACIMEFPGRRKIRDLEIFPIQFHKDPTLSDKLVARGRKFVEIAMREPYMMSFAGETLDREASPMWWKGDEKKKMSERVVLDARAYNHYYRRLGVSKWKRRDELEGALASKDADHSIFLYCCPELYCFALQRKKWVRAWIDDLTGVQFNDLAYPSLVLPKDYKELLLAFAEAQIDGAGFDDVIAGKGQGILMLLAGAPGTGKTLTAEAMAEHMKRPLYSVSAGELGSSPGGMESELDRVLELCTRWNAVLLLDEADVFLVKRTDNDLHRNSIVSVFLKKLEYYRGIMFLTTNRSGSFDEAFKSRIHVAIRYPDLDAAARRTVWSNFLKKAGAIYQHGVDVSAEDVDELSQKILNGREIRNIVKTAQLLASRTKQPLSKKQMDTVWKVEHEDSAWDKISGNSSQKALVNGGR